MESIGNFAESLILSQVEDVQSGKTLPPSLEEAASKSGSAPAKDIRNISVPEDMMQQILGEAYTQEEPTTEALPELVWTDPVEELPVEEKPDPISLTEETAAQLVSLMEDLKGLVSELKEMTACTTGSGNIGMNLSGPTKETSKRTKKNALKAALRKRSK